jgi:hypothetical protein
LVDFIAEHRQHRHPKLTAAVDISSRLSAQVLDAIEDAHHTLEIALSSCTPSWISRRLETAVALPKIEVEPHLAANLTGNLKLGELIVPSSLSSVRSRSEGSN